MNFMHIYYSFLHFLTNELELHLNMFGLGMESWIPCKIQGTLIVTKQRFSYGESNGSSS